jgi:NADP-dependent 3-hydroxy acid dehydrogenase YdfG
MPCDMDLDLSGKVVAVTGASSGIGEAVAVACAGAGAKVALAARREDRIAALAERIGGIAVPTDVSDEAQARAFVERTQNELGGLDVLVNNAGVMLLGPIVGAPVDEWRTMIDVNLFGVLYCTHAALPGMLERGGGTIINVSSTAGRIARVGSGVYNATKFGVGAFSESLRQEVTERHVRIGLIEPGAVATELVGHNRPSVRKSVEERFGDTERLEAQDIADAIGYVVTRPRHIAINEVLIRPTEQQG